MDLYGNTADYSTGGSATNDFTHASSAPVRTQPVAKSYKIETGNNVNKLPQNQMDDLLTRVPSYLGKIEALLENLHHPEAPTIGRDFIRQSRLADCTYVIDPDDDHDAAQAFYAAYHPAVKKHNKMFFNPTKIRMDKFHVFYGSSNHEHIHAIANRVAPALQYTPWNPDTVVLIHPLDKMRLDNLSERDAYAKQALLNILLAQATPDFSFRKTMMKDTRMQVVNMMEMHKLFKSGLSLQDILVEAAIKSLDKPYKRSEPWGRNFNDSYFKVTLGDYKTGLQERLKETPHAKFVYVRLEEEDFHALGDYGVGPNSLGRGKIDPRFMAPLNLRDNELAMYEKLCRDYNIPAYEDCMTLQDHLAPAEPETTIEAEFTIQAQWPRQNPADFQRPTTPQFQNIAAMQPA